MSATDTADVLSRIDPEHWSVTIRDGEPILGISVAGAADYVLSQPSEHVSLEDVLLILADLLPASTYRSVVAELEQRGEVIGDV